MSWNIDENYKIEMTKGDTPTFGFDIFLPDGSAYEIEKGDRVVFAAKANKYDAEPAFTIEADMVTKTIHFKEEHTKSLEIGKYIWELSLNKENGYRCTFIANTDGECFSERRNTDTDSRCHSREIWNK